MTYRKFLKAYQQQRQAVTPDIDIMLPAVDEKTHTLTKQRKSLLVPTVAAAAIICVISTVLFWQLRPTGSPKPQSQPSSVPNITVSAILYKSLESDTTVLPQSTTIRQYVGARMVSVTAPTPFEGHESCSTVFYQLDNQNIYCVNHLLLDILSDHGIHASGVLVHFYETVRKVAVFTLSDNTRHSYWYDISTDTLKKLPASLYHCSVTTEGTQSPYALLHSAGGKHDDLYVIDVQNGDLKNIVKDTDGNYLFDPMEDEKLVVNNRYVLYTHGTGDGNTVTSPSRTSVLYDVATGKSYSFQGQVEAELSDGLLIHHPDGYGVYSLTDHTVTPLENCTLPPQYTYHIQQTDLYSRYSYRLNVLNRLTGEVTLLSEDYLVEHLISPDYRYVYYYVRGENYIRVFDLASGIQDTLPLFADVTAETESDEQKNNTIFFSLWMNESGNEIVLTYQYSAHPREDPETIRKEQENSSFYLLDALRRDPNRGFVSIASLEPILQRFPERVTAYQGDGYLYIDYTRLRTEDDARSSRDRKIALEDYVTSMFYDLSHLNESLDSQFTITNQYALSKTAEQETLRILKACNVLILPAAKNYQQFFADKEPNELKIHVEHSSSQNVLPRTRGYFVRKAHGYDGAMMGLEESADQAILRDFLTFSDTLNYTHFLSPADETQYLEVHTYWVECYGNNLPFDGVIFIGKRNGQPFLVRNRCLASLSSADYQAWCATLADQEPKCRID